MISFNVVASTSEDTVVATYEPSKVRSDSYQSEAELEKEFIRLLCEQGYTYLPLHTEDELIANLRSQLEELNHYQFSDTEWQQFFSDVIANPNEHIPEKTRKIQEDNVQVLHRDDGSSKNITLIDKKNIHNNRLQVINQYEVKQADGARHDNRYDVTILVNGFPLVHVELKRRGVAIREAFNQINRYQRDSFWAGCGLYEYVQIFVISNGTNTKYYSNSTRYNAIKDAKHGKTKKEKTSNSFEFTSYWADANNRVLTDLIDFTRTFFAKHTILSVLTRYCIFTSEKMLMVMRPYQITATERILNRIEIANNYKKYGSIEGGGYIWHTTGSGKTLTSFKTARLASQLPYIDKVLFVVDRKDLDYQTMKEYDRFEKGAANSNTSTTILKRQLENPEAHIIITTIQKLATFIKKNPGHEVYQKHVVIIFDECHRSQFGDMHKAIAEQGVNAEERGYLSGIVRRVDEQYYTDEWAKCCLLLYKKELLQKLPLCLRRLFFRHPEKMKMFLEENPSRLFDVENDYYLPEEAYQDKRAFDCWAECLYEEFPEILGYIMGKSCNGKDGAFPHEFIREFLEKQQNEKLTKVVVYGKFNSRGARIVQDGRNLYEQAKCYQAQARELELRFPQSAEILRQLAKWLESEAQHDQLEAEIVP